MPIPHRLRRLSPAALILIGSLVTGIALLESWKAWVYAPFPIAHAALALSIPAWYGVAHVGSPRGKLRSYLRGAAAPLMVAVLFIGGYVLLYGVFLRQFGRAGDAHWNLLATYAWLGRLYIARYNLTTVLILGYLFVGVWPMFGEEFFYRGFLFRGLTYHVSPGRAAVISSALFGLRHAFQLGYLLPAYPVVSGAAYFVWAFGLGILWAWAYHRCQSLWPCLVAHSANLLLVPIAFIKLGLWPGAG